MCDVVSPEKITNPANLLYKKIKKFKIKIKNPADFKTSLEKKCCSLCSLKKLVGKQQPSPHMQGWVITMMGMKLILSFILSLSLSHTLSFLRGVMQQRYLFLPFLAGFTAPSSEKLTGPVQFPVSSPLSRLNCCALVRKWVSLFGIYCPYCANVKHTITQTHKPTG